MKTEDIIASIQGVVRRQTEALKERDARIEELERQLSQARSMNASQRRYIERIWEEEEGE